MSHLHDESGNHSNEVSPLSADEKNILRYAARYVPFKLLKQYERSLYPKSVSMIECLSAMAINGDESNFLEYTTKWIGIVNRGELFEINDTTYMFFK